jgi:type II secretory pathway pseudopilin PulG
MLKLKSKGFGLIEILVAAALVGLVLVTLISLGNFALKAQAHFKKNLVAVNLAAESIEAVKSLKDENWTNISGLSMGTPYYPVVSGTPLKFSLAAGQESINGFSRRLLASQVYRDVEDDIVSSGGTLDPGTIKITSIVSWSERGRLYEIILVDYLSNWRQ